MFPAVSLQDLFAGHFEVDGDHSEGRQELSERSGGDRPAAAPLRPRALFDCHKCVDQLLRRDLILEAAVEQIPDVGKEQYVIRLILTGPDHGKGLGSMASTFRPSTTGA